jgi:hypothetical protein
MGGLPWITTQSVASGIAAALASVPATFVSFALVQAETGTWRWSETTGSMLTASTGLRMLTTDAPRQVDPRTFQAMPLAGGGVLQATFYL